MSWRQKRGISATTIAAHHHYQCDLFLYNAYNGSRSSSGRRRPSNPELTKARLTRGDKWEDSLFSWLDEHGLLLRVLGGFLEGHEIQEVIDIDERDHFFVAGLSFTPPEEAFEPKFRRSGRNPVLFSIAKPDLIEINRERDGTTRWQVIDAKSSTNVKTSHHVQVYFYHLCLEHLLSSPRFKPMNSVAIWLPHSIVGHSEPSLENLKIIGTTLLSLPLDEFLFNKLPEIVESQREDVKWHLNPLCQGCPYESECMANALREGRIGAMANISIQDAEVLRSVLLLVRKQGTEHTISDIEDLHSAVSSWDAMRSLGLHHPSTLKKAKRILKLPAKAGSQRASSPIVNAARLGEIQAIGNRVFTMPSDEDIAIVISLVLDPGIGSIAAFCISTYVTLPREQVTCPPPINGTASELIPNLSSVLQYILDLTEVLTVSPRTQCYVFSISERNALQRFLIESALTSDPTDDDLQNSIRVCIGALCEGASLLATSFQPLVLSGALLDFLGKKGSATDLQTCRQRLGLPMVPGTDDEIRKQIMDEINRLKGIGKRRVDPDSSDVTDEYSADRPEIGQLPRVVVLKQAVERLLALPLPGYWDLHNCHAVLSSGSASTPTCPTDEEVFSAVSRNADDSKLLLRTRNDCIYEVLLQARSRVSNALVRKSEILVNEARVLSAEFMDICRQDHLRKLFFMQQFEVLARLMTLWQERLDGCADAARLEYQFTHRLEDKTYVHYFSLISGYIDLPSDKEKSFFGYILTEDTESDNDIPAEASFDDLWLKQSRLIQEKIFVADVQDTIIRDNRTLVVAKTSGGYNLRLKRFTQYRLSPRLVDFNVTKILSTLAELDFQTPAYPGYLSLPPFLQLFSDPQAFAKFEDENRALVSACLKAEDSLQKMYKELASLNVETAPALLLQPSQRKALRRILKFRLAGIWGPPGTGKTYTISLSLLRLMEIRHRCKVNGRLIMFLTAMTHAAITACMTKIKYLIEAYRRIPGLRLDWLDNLRLEHVSVGTTHAAPSNEATYIYAGTVYQLYNFSRRTGVIVDCVVIDEAGQLGLGPASLVLKSLRSDGRVIVAGDSEQLAPITTARYPQVEPRLFGSILDCLMQLSSSNEDDALIESRSIVLSESSQESTIVQLTENFRLNPDLGEFISTIYKKSLKPQKIQTREIAEKLGRLRSPEGSTVIHQSARNIILAISAAMLRKRQEILKEPSIKSTATISPREESVDWRGISLALIRLSTFSKSLDQVGYETHVRAEATFAAALVRLFQQAAPEETVFVATPHRIQRHAVNDALRTRVDDLAEAFGAIQLKDDEEPPLAKDKVTIDTIERLQGSEADFVICLFSYTYSANAATAVDFLLERRRLNVAISRAKTLCVLVTSREVLQPSVRIFANPQSAKGFAFLKAYEDRAWSTDVNINLDELDNV